MTRKVTSVICFILFWQICALYINKPIIFPYPTEVFVKMVAYLGDKSFYQAVLSTLGRTALSFLIAFIIGLTLGLISGLNSKLKDYISPIISILQTIPQIAFVLVILFWFNSLQSLIITVCLMLVPSFYYNIVAGLENIDQELKDVITLYHHPLYYTIPHIYLPLIKGYILSAIDNCLPLSLKVGVMAEIFVSAKAGIGKKLYYARTSIDMAGILALTIWMVILIFVINGLYHLIIKKSVQQ